MGPGFIGPVFMGPAVTAPGLIGGRLLRGPVLTGGGFTGPALAGPGYRCIRPAAALSSASGGALLAARLLIPELLIFRPPKAPFSRRGSFRSPCASRASFGVYSNHEMSPVPVPSG